MVIVLFHDFGFSKKAPESSLLRVSWSNSIPNSLKVYSLSLTSRTVDSVVSLMIVLAAFFVFHPMFSLLMVEGANSTNPVIIAMVTTIAAAILIHKPLLFLIFLLLVIVFLIISTGVRLGSHGVQTSTVTLGYSSKILASFFSTLFQGRSIFPCPIWGRATVVKPSAFIHISSASKASCKNTISE